MRPLITIVWINVFLAIGASSFLLEPWLMEGATTSGDGNLMVLIIAQMYYVFFFALLNLLVGIVSIYRARAPVPFRVSYVLPNRKTDGILTLLCKITVLLIGLYDLVMAGIYVWRGAFERLAVPLTLSVLLICLAMSWMLGMSAVSSKAHREKQYLAKIPSAPLTDSIDG